MARIKIKWIVYIFSVKYLSPSIIFPRSANGGGTLKRTCYHLMAIPFEQLIIQMFWKLRAQICSSIFDHMVTNSDSFGTHSKRTKNNNNNKTHSLALQHNQARNRERGICGLWTSTEWRGFWFAFSFLFFFSSAIGNHILYAFNWNT